LILNNSPRDLHYEILRLARYLSPIERQVPGRQASPGLVKVRAKYHAPLKPIFKRMSLRYQFSTHLIEYRRVNDYSVEVGKCRHQLRQMIQADRRQAQQTTFVLAGLGNTPGRRLDEPLIKGPDNGRVGLFWQKTQPLKLI